MNPSCCTVIDSGFSFTHAMPFIDGKCRKSGVKRVNVGGKLLTNYLKEVVRYMYVYMYIYIHTYIYIYKHMYIYIYIYT
jgi:actin-related protein